MGPANWPRTRLTAGSWSRPAVCCSDTQSSGPWWDWRTQRTRFNKKENVQRPQTNCWNKSWISHLEIRRLLKNKRRNRSRCWWIIREKQTHLRPTDLITVTQCVKLKHKEPQTVSACREKEWPSSELWQLPLISLTLCQQNPVINNHLLIDHCFCCLLLLLFVAKWHLVSYPLPPTWTPGAGLSLLTLILTVALSSTLKHSRVFTCYLSRRGRWSRQLTSGSLEMSC